jgi:hypothetical protein
MNVWIEYDRWEARMDQATRDAVREGCKRSAAAVLPVVFAMLGTPSALLDVGAGEGWWSKAAFEDFGVDEAYSVDREEQDDPDQGWLVAPWDAENFEELPGRCPAAGDQYEGWPLALCLEVAEHLTPAAGDHLVAELCHIADEIVWSAAIPGQGGDGHINEQWPAYWAERFERHGYCLDDPWRLDLWENPDVEPWYAQNILYAYRQSAGLGAPHALVHPVTWSHHRGVRSP